MTTRRHFLASSSLLAVSCAAAVPARASGAPVSDAELQRQVLGKLTNELNDSTVATDETGYLLDTFFAWSPPTVDAAGIDTIAAFGFGNRAGASGAAPVPGPMNEAIADAVYQLWQKVRAPIYAQQEVAGVLASKYGLTAGVTSIATPAVVSGSPIPTPDGVAAAIVRQAGSAAALGKVGIVTHLDQASLAVRVSTAAGLQAAVPAGLTLPVFYDTAAQMPALRRRDLYLLSSAGVQLGLLRLALISREYPNG